MDAILAHWLAFETVRFSALEPITLAALAALLLATVLQPPLGVLCIRIILRTPRPAPGSDVPSTTLRAQTATGNVLLLSPLLIGAGIAGLDPTIWSAAFFLALVLFVLALMDARHRWLPDRTLLGLAAVGVIAHVKAAPGTHDVMGVALGLLINFEFWVVLAWGASHWLSRAGGLSHHEAGGETPRLVGWGDVKFIAAMSVWLPASQMALALNVALAGLCCLALLRKVEGTTRAVQAGSSVTAQEGGQQDPAHRSPLAMGKAVAPPGEPDVAFGPFLALGFWVAWCWAQGWSMPT